MRLDKNKQDVLSMSRYRRYCMQNNLQSRKKAEIKQVTPRIQIIFTKNRHYTPIVNPAKHRLSLRKRLKSTTTMDIHLESVSGKPRSPSTARSDLRAPPSMPNDHKKGSSVAHFCALSLDFFRIKTGESFLERKQESLSKTQRNLHHSEKMALEKEHLTQW